MLATVEAEVAGGKLMNNGWVTFTVLKPSLAAPSSVPDYMTYVFAALLLSLVAYAYLKR